MKKLLSTAIATTLAATGLMATTAAFTTASADVAYNAGVMSQYVFRGMVQRGGSSLMGGADYTNDSGLYAGVWAAQVGTEAATSSIGTNNGLEIDLYGGIKKEFSGVTLGAGFTSYQYTNKSKYDGALLNAGFDSAYNELNFSVAYGPITATINPGYHEGAGNGLSNKDYVFYSLKGEYAGFYALYGAFDKKAEAKGTASSIPTAGASFDGYKDGSYVQAGYKTALGGLDIDAYLINSSKELNTVGTDAGTKDATTFSVSATKAF